MLKYYRSDIYKSRTWLEIDELDPLKVIENYYYNKCYVNDADTCGNSEIEFAFSMGGASPIVNYYELSYSWWIEYDPEWEIHNEHYITKINSPEFKFPSDRDWIDL